MQGEVFLPLIGGAIIEIASSLMLLLNGKITGISGIYTGVLNKAIDIKDKALFVLGLIAGGLALNLIGYDAFERIESPILQIVVAGLLVGFGTRLGSGCTSGNGICGLSRQSPRSLANVMAFIGSGIITVLLLYYFTN